MTKDEKVANIICFLTIIFGEEEGFLNAIMKWHPDYIIQKFERYVLSNKAEYKWGVHPNSINAILLPYTIKWNLELKEE